MKETKSKFVLYTPFTGLGLYGGFRGNRWLRNRITVFKQFVIPAMANQTQKDFVHWISWREDEKDNKHVKALGEYLKSVDYPYVFTFGGICFWDDKFEDEIAHERLFRALKASLPELLEPLSDCDEIHWLLVPSDDLYDHMTIESVRKAFNGDPSMQAVSYTKGYLCNYTTKEILEYNPKTNPPFFAIRFPRSTFFDPGKHMNYTGPYKSHEYIGEKLKLAYFEGRGFLVGTHGENISTHFNHPFGGRPIDDPVEKQILMERFGMVGTPAVRLPISVRKAILRKLPYKVQRKLRYWFGELFWSKLYNFLRN